MNRRNWTCSCPLRMCRNSHVLFVAARRRKRPSASRVCNQALAEAASAAAAGRIALRPRVDTREAAADPIDVLVRLWKEDMQKKHRMDRGLFIAHFVENTDYITAIKRCTSDISTRSRVLPTARRLISTRCSCSSLWMNTGLKANASPRGAVASGFQQRRRTTGICRPTNDWMFWDGFQIVLRIKQPGSDLESLVHRSQAAFGWNGVKTRVSGSA